MVEWWKGELLIREKKISLLVMFCQCTISFGKQKLYVKSGFQFSLKNFWRFLHLQNWYGTLQAKVESLMSNLPSKTSKSEKLSHFYWWPAMIISLSRRLFINLSEVIKWRIRNLEFKKIIIYKIIQFSNLYSNTLNFVFKVTLKANK